MGYQDDLCHVFLTCGHSEEISTSLFTSLRLFLPQLSKDQMLTLSYDCEENLELPVAWLISSCFLAIWNRRMEKKPCSLFTIRADLEAKVSLLVTRYSVCKNGFFCLTLFAEKCPKNQNILKYFFLILKFTFLPFY